MSQVDIVNLLKRKGEMTINQISKKLKISPNAVRVGLRQLLKYGEIRCVERQFIDERKVKVYYFSSINDVRKHEILVLLEKNPEGKGSKEMVKELKITTHQLLGPIKELIIEKKILPAKNSYNEMVGEQYILNREKFK